MVSIGRKAFFVLLVLQLTAATFSVAALHDACLCGQACRHGLGEEAETRDCGTHHDRCGDSDCQSCNVEKMVNLDLDVFHNTYDGVRTLETPHAVAVSSDHFCYNHTPEHFCPIYSGGDRDSPPIYLRNLSLLC